MDITTDGHKLSADISCPFFFAHKKKGQLNFRRQKITVENTNK